MMQTRLLLSLLLSATSICAVKRKNAARPLNVALVLSGGVFRQNCPRTTSNSACTGSNASVESQRRASESHQLVIGSPRFARVDVYISTPAPTAHDALLTSWYSPNLVAFMAGNESQSALLSPPPEHADSPAPTSNDGNAHAFETSSPAAAAAAAALAESNNQSSFVRLKPRSCSSRNMHFGGRSTWRLPWAERIRSGHSTDHGSSALHGASSRSPPYDGLIVMRPDMVRVSHS